MNNSFLWGFVFFIILISFIYRITLKRKGIVQGNSGFSDKIVFVLLLYLIFRLWNNNAIDYSSKLLNICLGILAVGACILYWKLPDANDSRQKPPIKKKDKRTNTSLSEKK